MPPRIQIFSEWRRRELPAQSATAFLAVRVFLVPSQRFFAALGVPVGDGGGIGDRDARTRPRQKTEGSANAPPSKYHWIVVAWMGKNIDKAARGMNEGQLY